MNELKIGCLELGVMGNNCYFIHRDGEYDCIVVDPAKNGDVIATRLREKGLTVKAIVLTHAHFDHILGVADMKKITEAPIYGGEGDIPLFTDSVLNGSAKINHPVQFDLDIALKDGDEIETGNIKAKIMSTPGHSKGSICLYFEEDKVLISGDTLFCESVGRTDLEGGSAGEIKESLRRLMELPDDIKVYPGHGDFTTIGHERNYNPFVASF